MTKVTPKVTILVPNYKTLVLTKLCLRLLRKYTCPNEASIIVIDNDSQDESLLYLKTLSWITLIERKAVPNESPVESHARALDLGLSQVETPYVLSIHTDTLVKHHGWLPFLIREIQKDPNIAGVGSWKLESKAWWQTLLKMMERKIQLTFYQLLNKNYHRIEGVGKNYYYLRSHCAMYRTDLLHQYHLCFAGGDLVAGKDMHQKLIAHGHDLTFLPSDVLIKYLEHVNHATTVLNPALSSREKSLKKGRYRIKKSLAKLKAESLLADDSLDR
jgi:hypothetical protein